MFIVHTRRKFLAADEPGAVTVCMYRHVQQGEPALNHRLHMTRIEAETFAQMLRDGQTESKDIVAGYVTTYTITND